MPSQLTEKETDLIDGMLRDRQNHPMDTFRAVNKARKAAGADEVNKTTAYRYINGETHRRGRFDGRGNTKQWTKSDARKLFNTRKRLIKAGTGRVTHEQVHRESGLQQKFCQRVAEEALRSLGVRYRRPRSKIYIDTDDAKVRWRVCKVWAKRPTAYWTNAVDAYIDNKQWPLPLTPKQRKHFQQTCVSGHLRTQAEGVEQGFTRPRQKHAWIGMPSVNIAAAVNKNRFLMWRVVKGSWNGAAAADLYKGPLLSALRRTYGKKTSYAIVEDGDRKGFQSGKGIKAKKESGIRSIKLPPRTPSLMPLDFSLWQKIMEKMVAAAPKGTESKKVFLARLERTAHSLPRSVHLKAVSRMKKNCQAIVDAKGWHPKND